MAILIMTEVLKISLHLCLIIWLLTSLLMEIKFCQAANNIQTCLHNFGIHLKNQYSFQGWDQHTLSHFEINPNQRLTENICHRWSQNIAHAYESQVAIH